MLEAHVATDSTVSLAHVPTPQIQSPTEILVQVEASGVNPKDWKIQSGILTTISACPNSGDDVAGIVVSVGTQVKDFKVGDRIAGLHELGSPRGGTFAEYAILEEWTTFHVPDGMPLEEASTVPMAGLMAAIGFFGLLDIAKGGPWGSANANNNSTGNENGQEDENKTPFVIYGASSAMGSTVVQYAKRVDVHPLICVVGKGADVVRPLLDPSKGDVIVDYRNGDKAVVQGIRDGCRGMKLWHAFDAVSAHGSWINIGKVLEPNGGQITLVLPGTRSELPPGVKQTCTMAGSLWKDLEFEKEGMQGDLGLKKGKGKEFGMVFSRLIGRWLADGTLKTYPYRVEADGLDGLEGALLSLRQGKTSGFKHVVRIADTPELKKQKAKQEDDDTEGKHNGV